MSTEKWFSVGGSSHQDNFMDIRILPPNPQFWVLMVKHENQYICADPSEKGATRFITLDIGDKRGEEREAGIQGIAFVRGVLNNNVIYQNGLPLAWNMFRSQKAVIEYAAIGVESNSPADEQIGAALKKYKQIIIEFLNREYECKCIADISIEAKDKDFQMKIHLDRGFIDAVRTLVFRPTMAYDHYVKEEVIAGQIVEQEHINPYIIAGDYFTFLITKHHEIESNEYYKALDKMEKRLPKRTPFDDEVWNIKSAQVFMQQGHAKDRLTIKEIDFRGVKINRAVVIPKGDDIYLGFQVKDRETKGFSDVDEVKAVLKEIAEDMQAIYNFEQFDIETQSYPIIRNLGEAEMDFWIMRDIEPTLEPNEAFVLPLYKAKLRLRRLVLIIRRIKNPESLFSTSQGKETGFQAIRDMLEEWGFKEQHIFVGKQKKKM